ncbi:ethanolamine ammonia-lyase subunit EutC [Bermanella marisrubri]|uniref:Ethanolamine ammonia-lyase small subunit n=1 Tax=Bermanella marisrubri TaxID=207949 RepID=Q1N3B8_9GAMM|nr:ethanolamine ammonia-lyase subunit EutC [Bermanella marisrubri]EAT12673.1 ethanolamine ammonia-lyase small subunit [Oceanobacter sp. RED65] [Bermanella marisrubri]QIZ85204.1 ethanolamine ammonia-lyase subunit EutC [Bermanella marisrubri]
MTTTIIANPWSKLQRFTDARIGLGRAGTSLPTHEWLSFQLSHAKAQDAVHKEFDVEKLYEQIDSRPWNTFGVTRVKSEAQDRAQYLQRPDLGRQLRSEDIKRLKTQRSLKPYDVAFLICDGLSAIAVEQNTTLFLDHLVPKLIAHHWSVAPIVIAEQGRVALGDDVAEAIGAKCIVVLIGERPGLSSPDSLGLYLTWAAERGCNDAMRNCISNIRPKGLNYSLASQKAWYLLQESRRLQLSGVNLKENADIASLSNTQASLGNFLTEG